MRSDALNLKVICEAMDRHDRSCDFPLTGVALCSFEYERLGGWDTIRGVQVLVDPEMQSGRFRLICDRTGHAPKEAEKIEEVLAA